MLRTFNEGPNENIYEFWVFCLSLAAFQLNRKKLRTYRKQVTTSMRSQNERIGKLYHMKH